MLEQKDYLIILLTAILSCFSGPMAFAQSDIDEHRSCSQCNMDRKAFGYSRMLVQYQDGAAVGVCSLHCAVVEIDANKTRAVKTLLVADRDTRDLLEAEKAVWVKGGKKRGVMTQRPTWAFATKTAADVFIRSNGGAISPWSDVLASVRLETAQEHR